MDRFGHVTSRATTAWVAAMVAVLAGVTSLSRILVANGNALSDLVWAEDGLFAMCVKAHGPISCTAEPYAGYILGLPRLAAIPVSVFPLDTWPLVSNLVAALLAAVLAAVVVVILRAAACEWVVSALVAMLPTLLPLMGIEGINSTANSYMVIPFVAALAISLPPVGRFPTVAVALLLFLAQMSNPVTAVLLVVVVIHGVRGRIPKSGAIAAGAALLMGLVLQGIAASTAANPRKIVWSLDSVREWAGTAPSAVITFWRGNPGVAADGSLASILQTGWVASLGLVLTAALVVAAVVLLLPRFSSFANGIGMLLLLGLAMGVLPALAGEPNNRYFVAAALAWSAAALIALDHWLPARRELVMGIVAVVIVVLSIPGFEASAFRTFAAPKWPDMLAGERANCAVSPDGGVKLMFTPTWPYPDNVLPGPTSNAVACSRLAQWG
jgi:hypothetical protein